MERPKLLIIAGPNGAGKTTVTSQILKHEWVEGCEYINPDFIARDKLWRLELARNALRIAQRVMQGGHDVPIQKIISRYYKSIANCILLSQVIVKQYAPMHEWAKLIYENCTQ